MPETVTIALNPDVTYVAYSRVEDMYYALPPSGHMLPCIDEATARDFQKFKNEFALEYLADMAAECEQNINDDTFARYQYAADDVTEAENSCLIKL